MNTAYNINTLFVLGFTFILGMVLGIYLYDLKYGPEVIRAEYTQKLKSSQDMYEQQLNGLITLKDSLETKITTTATTIDSLNGLIVERAEALDSIKHVYDEQIDNITSMSHHELIEFFSNRY